MKGEDLTTWEDFEERLNELLKLNQSRIQQKSMYKLIYRGQKDSEDNLNSTLERIVNRTMSFEEYYNLISKVKPRIESFSRKKWNYTSFKSWMDNTYMPDLGLSPQFTPIYSYMAHLRHYGFPSPMIDWSSSPYIAAYFAFRHAVSCPDKKVSVYAFLEPTNQTWSSNYPSIRRFGPYVKTARRHSLQKSQYTICLMYDGSVPIYAPHEESIAGQDGLEMRDEKRFMWKFNIPYYERLKVLKLLDSDAIGKINAFSLFKSGESLMETMALRALEFKNPYH